MQNPNAIVGMCNQMCPESEIRMRETQKLLHPMEILMTSEKSKQPIADRDKMVKAFCRSSAGQNMQKPDVLRPYHVLLDTITYLLHMAINNEDFPWHVRYDFITDRLRAIRQDIIIQDMPNHQAISLLQPVVRFYAYASYRMCNEKLEDFDPYLNNKHLQECLKRLLAMYDECDEFSTRSHQCIDYSKLLQNTRPQIEAIYILFNLGCEEVLYRALGLDPRWKTTPEVRSALKVSLLYRSNNFVAVCKRIQSLPHLMAAVVMLHLPEIRKLCLKSMSCAYSSKVLRFPLGKLQEMLCYTHVNNLVDDLKKCGITLEVPDVAWEAGNVDEDTQVQSGVIFTKGKFNDCAKLSICRERFVEDQLRGFSVTELVLFGPS